MEGFRFCLSAGPARKPPPGTALPGQIGIRIGAVHFLLAFPGGML